MAGSVLRSDWPWWFSLKIRGTPSREEKRNPVSRGDRHLKAEQRTIFDAVARGFLFSRGRKKQKQNKGPWGGTSSGHCGIHMPDTRPHTTPNPQTAFARVPAGQVAIAGPWVTPREPQRPKRGESHHSSQKKCSAQTTARRPPEHTRATPNANQAPQGGGTSPRSPLVAMGGLWGCQKIENSPTSLP